MCDSPDCTTCGTAVGCYSPPKPPRPPPHPPLPPNPPAFPPDTSQYWVDSNGRLQTTAFSIGGDGELAIKGVSWFGLESRACYIGGGDKYPLAEAADFLVSNGFNAVRVPLAASEVLAATGSTSCLDHGVYYTHNPELVGLDYMSGLEWFVKMLGARGLLVMLDYHVDEPGKWPDEGTMEDEASHTAVWLELARRFCSVEYWNVFAADLKNEPHGMYWGAPPEGASPILYPPDQRWDAVASRLASAVHRSCPRWVAWPTNTREIMRLASPAT